MNYAPVKKYLALLALYLLLALVLTYPLALHLNTHIPGHDTDGPAQTWSLWWTRYALLDLGRAPFTTDYLFYPLGLNLVAYTPAFLNGILSLPLQFVFGVIVAQNLMVLFALTSGAFGAYLFVRQVLRDPKGLPHTELAAVTAGALYGFGAWHLNYVVAGHFMLLSNQWLPYYALYLVRLGRRDASWRDGGMLGLFIVLIGWTELTFLPFIAILTLLYFVYWVVTQRPPFTESEPLRIENPRSGFGAPLAVGFQPMAGLVLAIIIALVGLCPLILSLALDFQRYGYYLTSGVGRIQIFSAEPISFFVPSGQHPVLGAWASALTDANTSYAFIGWAALTLALVGLYVKRSSPAARFWFVAAVLFALLMLGSTLYIGGVNTNLPMPFALLRLIPFVNANRYPARFNVMLMLALAPLVAWGVSALWNAPQSAYRVALVALLALLVFEQLVLPIPLTDVRVPPIFEMIRAEPGDFTVLELPLGWRGSIVMQGETDDVAQFFQTTDHKRRLGGITSRFPDFKLRYFAQAPVLRSLIALETGRPVDEQQRAQDRAESANVLDFFDIRYVSMNRAQTAPETLAFIQETFPLQEIYSGAERVVYRVTRPPRARRTEIDPASDFARLLFDDGWGNPQEDNAGFGYRWAMDRNARVWLPLEEMDYNLTFRLRAARPNETLRLRVNDVQVAEWQVGNTWGEYGAQIPKNVLHDGLDELVFVTETTALQDAAPDDRTIGNAGVVAPVDISATGAGFDAGKYGEIFVAGRNVIPNTRGYHLAAINAQTGTVDAVGAFDTFADDNASRRLAEFVGALPAGEIVAGVAIDDASQKLTDDAFAALQMLGVASDVRGQFRAGHAFIGITGIAPGQAVEDVSVSVPANVAIGKNVSQPHVSLALGPFTVNRVK